MCVSILYRPHRRVCWPSFILRAATRSTRFHGTRVFDVTLSPRVPTVGDLRLSASQTPCPTPCNPPSSGSAGSRVSPGSAQDRAGPRLREHRTRAAPSADAPARSPALRSRREPAARCPQQPRSQAFTSAVRARRSPERSQRLASPRFRTTACCSQAPPGRLACQARARSFSTGLSARSLSTRPPLPENHPPTVSAGPAPRTRLRHRPRPNFALAPPPSSALAPPPSSRSALCPPCCLWPAERSLSSRSGKSGDEETTARVVLLAFPPERVLQTREQAVRGIETSGPANCWWSFLKKHVRSAEDVATEKYSS